MCVIYNIRGHEIPLGYGGSIHVHSEVIEIPNPRATRGDGSDGIENGVGIVFTDVICIRGGGGVQVVGLSEAIMTFQVLS